MSRWYLVVYHHVVLRRQKWCRSSLLSVVTGPTGPVLFATAAKTVEADMTKKIAVVVRDRQDEALRMSIGIILLDDQIDVYVVDHPLSINENNSLYLETIEDMEMSAFTNVAANKGMQLLTIQEIATRLPDYDHVIPY